MLNEAVAVRENRRALLNNTARREDVLDQLIKQYVSGSPTD